MSKAEYYISVFNENEKYIKNTFDHCEVIQKVDGVLTHRTFLSPYPPGDEELKPISAQEWNKKFEEVKQVV